MNQSTRKALRAKIRKLRNSLTDNDQQLAQQQLSMRLQQFCSKTKPRSVAIYLANDGELSTKSFINWCWQQHINVYLPLIHPFSSKHLLFLRYYDNSKMQPNRFGINEPSLSCLDVIPPQSLDIIFTPLVAFDENGNRMGMGGGFYDRTLAHIDTKKTQIIGLAHDCQQVTQIPTESWDVPLGQIITPTQHIICRN